MPAPHYNCVPTPNIEPTMPRPVSPSAGIPVAIPSVPGNGALAKRPPVPRDNLFCADLVDSSSDLDFF